MNPERSREPGTIGRLVRPFQRFSQLEASGGILLIVCTATALIWANSPWAASYFHLWHMDLTFGFAGARLSKSLHFWINDGLMVLFFLLVGLEIKRETLVGELASFKKAMLPIAAAIGGMLIPAGFYLLLNRGGSGAPGWGIPMATDIAFALGVLALLGDRIPVSLRVFLAALAIADDIGAVLVIAFFYTATISWISLAIAGLIFAALLGTNRMGVRKPWVYTLLGIGLWIAFLKSGVHATVSGVLLAITIPASQRIDKFRAAETQSAVKVTEANKHAAIQRLADDSAKAESLLLRFEHALTPLIRHLVMPIFALANAGVVLGANVAGELMTPLSLGILCGLMFGKPIGIVGFSWLATRTGVATLPASVGWRQILGIGLLGGIGFTMSLFLANLAFGPTPLLETAKISILAASIVCGVGGTLVLLSEARDHRSKVQ